MANQFFTPFNFMPTSVDTTNSATTTSSQYARVTPTDLTGADLVIDSNTVLERTHYKGSWSSGSNGVKYTNNTRYILMIMWAHDSGTAATNYIARPDNTSSTGNESMYNPYSQTDMYVAGKEGGSAILGPGDELYQTVNTGTVTVYYTAWAVNHEAVLNKSFWVPPSTTVTATEFYIEYFDKIS